MRTFGFRGEALASISHVARVSVVTKTKDSPCAFRLTLNVCMAISYLMCRAEYLNGVLVNDPQPVAGNQGTTITVSDLFYNIPTRLKGMSPNGSEEYGHIVKMLQRYAVQLAGRVGIGCKKAGIGSGSDVQTSVSLTPDSNAAIKTIFGTQLSKGLASLGPLTHDAPSLQLSGCVSVPTFHQKSLTFILFINGRLVDSAPIKRAVISLYSQFLPKGTSPFVYLDLVMPPQSVDVNVHPTKSEVFFLYELQVLEFIDKSIREAIRSSPLPLETPIAVPFVAPIVVPIASSVVREDASQPTTYTPHTPNTPVMPTQSQTKKQLYPFQMVHSDPKTRTLDLFLTRATKRTRVDEHMASQDSIELTEVSVDIDPIRKYPVDAPVKPRYEPKPVALDSGTEDPRELTSVKELINAIESSRHDRLTEMIKNSVIVGLFDASHMLLQYQSQLIMIEHLRFALEMLYQKCLLGFGFHDCWKMPSGVDIKDLLTAHIDTFYPDSEYQVDELVSSIESNSELLLEYFSVHIANGRLVSLPRLLEGLEAPNEPVLAEFLFQLATETAWDSEEDCFCSIATLLAQAFSCFIVEQPRNEEYIRHFLYPALKGSDMSRFGKIIGYDKDLVNNGAIVEMTTTHELYKIFERC